MQTPSSTPGPLIPQIYSGAFTGGFCSGRVLKRRDKRKGARPEAGLAQAENPRTPNTEADVPRRRQVRRNEAAVTRAHGCVPRKRHGRRTLQKRLCMPQGWGTPCTPAEVSSEHSQGVGTMKTRDMAGPRSSPPSGSETVLKEKKSQKSKTGCTFCCQAESAPNFQAEPHFPNRGSNIGEGDYI